MEKRSPALSGADPWGFPHLWVRSELENDLRPLFTVGGGLGVSPPTPQARGQTVTRQAPQEGKPSTRAPASRADQTPAAP